MVAGWGRWAASHFLIVWCRMARAATSGRGLTPHLIKAQRRKSVVLRTASSKALGTV